MLRVTTPLRAFPPGVVAPWARALVLLAYLATLAITWNVWHHRTLPPMLPWVPAPSLSLGPLLVATALWASLRPRAGVVAHVLVLGYALLTDALRAQPYVLSLAVLLWASTARTPTDASLLVARAHLVSLWFWAAMHKALSPAFHAVVVPWVLGGLGWRAPEPWCGYVVIAAEGALAVGALVPRTRTIAAYGAALVHLSILAVISRPALGRNLALWPWNVSLALFPIALFAPWKEPLRQTLRTAPRPALVLAVLLLVAPAGYAFGVVGPTLAHVLYTGAAPEAVWCHADGRCEADFERRECLTRLRVMVPPEPRMLRQYFLARCTRGERLMIHDPRRDRDDGTVAIEEVRCP